MLGAIEIRLHYGADVRVLGAHAFYYFDGSLSVGRAFHVDAHEIRLVSCVRDNFFQKFLAEVFAEIEAELRQLQRNIRVQVFLRNAIENCDVFVSGAPCASFVRHIFAEQIQAG